MEYCYREGTVSVYVGEIRIPYDQMYELSETENRVFRYIKKQPWYSQLGSYVYWDFTYSCSFRFPHSTVVIKIFVHFQDKDDAILFLLSNSLPKNT